MEQKHYTELESRMGLAENHGTILQQANLKWKAELEPSPGIQTAPPPPRGIFKIFPRNKDKDRIPPSLANASRFPAGVRYYDCTQPLGNIRDMARDNHHILSPHIGVNQVYYISDIHLEHQVRLHENPSWEYLYTETDRMVSNMVRTALRGRGESSVLLIGGDVACSPAIASVFYDRLYAYWPGIVLSVLGNRELWNGAHVGCGPDIPLNDLVRQYRTLVEPAENLSGSTREDALFLSTRHTLLNNGIFFCYDNNWTEGLRYMDMATAMSASREDMTALFRHCRFVVLGGTGFSGNMPKTVSRPELYRAAVPNELEDIRLSRKFFFLHERLRECAGNIPVIVLTHTPPSLWGPEHLHERWIYVCGHGHLNQVQQYSEGGICFQDNQVGYEPRPWVLKSIAY